FVLDKLGLSLRQPRCMACGGELVEVSKEAGREPRAAPYVRLAAEVLGMQPVPEGVLARDPLETDRRSVALDDCHERRGRPDRATSADRPGGATLWQNDELSARLPTKTPPPSIRAPILQ